MLIENSHVGLHNSIGFELVVGVLLFDSLDISSRRSNATIDNKMSDMYVLRSEFARQALRQAS